MYLEPTLLKMYREEESIHFRYPVDVNIAPDYFSIIKNPMDLSTINKKLRNLEYKDPWQYINDVWLMFENAWLYNRKSSKIYKLAKKVDLFQFLYF